MIGFSTKLDSSSLRCSYLPSAIAQRLCHMMEGACGIARLLTCLHLSCKLESGEGTISSEDLKERKSSIDRALPFQHKGDIFPNVESHMETAAHGRSGGLSQSNFFLSLAD